MTKDLEDIIQVYMQHNIIYYSAVRIRTIPLVFFSEADTDLVNNWTKRCSRH
jgi:hypothetical protein